jgi:hypothetical protein
MALPRDDIELFKLLVDHYGYPNSWETNHWMHFNAMMDVLTLAYECDLSNSAQIGDDLIYEKRTQLVSLGLKADNFFALADKVLHMEGIELDEKIFLYEKSMDEGLNVMGEIRNLTQEYLNVMEGGVDNIRTFIPKKSVGRPRSNIIYHWMQHLELELGSKQKAADYVSDSRMARMFLLIGSKKTASLLREYRRYCNDKGEG